MADLAELQRLAWFSPAFPVGGYAYSHGIEMAVEAGDISDGVALHDWIEDILRHGTGRNDAVLLAEAWRRSGNPDRAARGVALGELAELALALGLSSERRLETSQQGDAFFSLVLAAWPHPDLPNDLEHLAYPVAVGIAGRIHGQPLAPLIAAYLQAFAANLLAASVRLAVIGQRAAQVLHTRLLPAVRDLAHETTSLGLDDLGAMTVRADLMSLRHETQTVRLFRS